MQILDTRRVRSHAGYFSHLVTSFSGTFFCMTSGNAPVRVQLLKQSACTVTRCIHGKVTSSQQFEGLQLNPIDPGVVLPFSCPHLPAPALSYLHLHLLSVALSCPQLPSGACIQISWRSRDIATRRCSKHVTGPAKSRSIFSTIIRYEEKTIKTSYSLQSGTKEISKGQRARRLQVADLGTKCPVPIFKHAAGQHDDEVVTSCV